MCFFPRHRMYIVDLFWLSVMAEKLIEWNYSTGRKQSDIYFVRNSQLPSRPTLLLSLSDSLFLRPHSALSIFFVPEYYSSVWWHHSHRGNTFSHSFFPQILFTIRNENGTNGIGSTSHACNTIENNIFSVPFLPNRGLSQGTEIKSLHEVNEECFFFFLSGYFLGAQHVNEAQSGRLVCRARVRI